MTYDVQAALADTRFETWQDVRYPRMTRRRSVATALRIDDRRWRVIMPRSPAGHGSGLRAQVTDGLGEGARVITHPGDELADGMGVEAR